MQNIELQMIASRARYMREAGIALIIGSGILAVFLFIPLAPQKQASGAAAVAASTTPDSFGSVQIKARSAIVYDLATGKTLYAKNADAQLPLASLTKLLTVYGALAELSPSTPITVSANAAQAESPHAFAPGDTLALSDLARITLTASLNDGAAAIAEATAAREQASTAAMMANAASALNLSATYAINGNGLDESGAVSGGYGSAHDMALLAGALVQKAPDIALATTQSSASATSLAGKAFHVTNTNPGVDTAPRLLLSKTGFTDLAGGNLVLVFDAGINHPVAVVVLGSTEKERFTDAQELVAGALAHFAGVASL